MTVKLSKELIDKIEEHDLKKGELTDEELDNVAGGADGWVKPANTYEMVYWDSEEDVQFIFKEGDIVEVLAFASKHHTATCKVVNKSVGQVQRCARWQYFDQYWLEKVPGCNSPHIKNWYKRQSIEK